MPNIPSLNVITKEFPTNATNLERIIAEKRLLKTQIKLIHIALFDKDLKKLNEEGYDIEGLSLKDFKLTSDSNLVVPVYNRIMPSIKSNNILESYLIYLSYLYNVDLITLYRTNYHLFYEIILSIELPVAIKMNIFELIKYHTGEYFSANIESLNNAEYREKISSDERRLRSLM